MSRPVELMIPDLLTYPHYKVSAFLASDVSATP
jgi:hypothetical protein